MDSLSEFKRELNVVLALIKYKVSIAVSFTAITGYIVFAGQYDVRILLLALGVFILAGGSSSLNEVQESKTDAKMARTKHRPIPSGKIPVRTALMVSMLFIVAGLILLCFLFGATTALLGLFNLAWYNGIYTNLKKITPFAVVPGSLVGAVPVFMGWTAAGGNLFESTIVFIAFFLFIWQIPHFWLLMLKYNREYEEAGFPTINQAVSPAGLKMIIYSWMIATSFISITIPLFLIKISAPFFLIVFVLNILFIAIFTRLAFGNLNELHFKRSFISINVYMFIFMIMLIVYHLFAV